MQTPNNPDNINHAVMRVLEWVRPHGVRVCVLVCDLIDDVLVWRTAKLIKQRGAWPHVM